MRESELIRSRYEKVVGNLHRVCQSVGRNPDEIMLVVVTKTHPVESIRAAIEAGANNFGENYVEDALPKIQALTDIKGLNWHMIGHIQSRKTTLVAENFDWVHSIDRMKIARRIDQTLQQHRKTIPVLLECNVSGERSKFGYRAWDEKDWPALADELLPITELKNIRLVGLMTMAPYFDQAEPARPFFRQLRRLAEFLQSRIPGHTFDQLSMGMSGDYQVAIQEGATILRIGTAILGER